MDGEDVESVDGDAGWAPPDDDVFAFITKLMRSAGTYLYGRRMYETLAVWETDSTLAARIRMCWSVARTPQHRLSSPGWSTS